MSFDWSQLAPGDVIVWVTSGNVQARRVLVEKIDPDALPSGSRFVWGVEVSSRFWLRGRRGRRDFNARPFWVGTDEVREVVPAADERAATAQAAVDRLRKPVAS